MVRDLIEGGGGRDNGHVLRSAKQVRRRLDGTLQS